MPISKSRREITYPLSFRVSLAMVEEIDKAVLRERRKRRSDLLEAIWQVAWANYQRSGSLLSYAEGRRQSARGAFRKNYRTNSISPSRRFWNAPLRR